MSDSSPSNRNLSDIGHLFLSSVRERHTNGAPRPVRRPPGSPPIEAAPLPPMELHLTEEVQPGDVADASEPSPHIPPVTAIIAAHLNGSQHERTRDYARHLAHDGQRIGLIEVDATSFKLSIFDRPAQGPGESAPQVQPVDYFDARAMNDAIEELSWDLDRWLLLLPNPRLAEARALLRNCPHWALLSTCDHDGVVSGYRMLKGLQEDSRPRLSLAILNAADDVEADKLHRKLASVCEQFLAWPLEAELPVCATEHLGQHVVEHVVMHCLANRSRAELPNPPQWRVTGEFLQRALNDAKERQETAENLHLAAVVNDGGADSSATSVPERMRMADEAELADPAPLKFEAPHAAVSSAETARAIPIASPAIDPVASAWRLIPMSTTPSHADPILHQTTAPRSADRSADRSEHAAGPATGSLPLHPDRCSEITEVIDLPDSAVTAGSILNAVLRNPAGGLVECPLSPPMCPDARLAVTRDRSLVLLAVSHQGLAEMRSIARGYRWLVENVALIRMAIPQMAVDTSTTPRLRLLVDHADLSAEILQPLLASETVTVQAYRRLRWGGKTGLLLEAA